jgi:hypothetical protein
MATTTITPEMEAMSLEDLRKHAEEEARKQSTKTPEQLAEEQKAADEAAKAEAERVAAEEEATVKEFFAERSFDLGDGAGSQVYKGKGATREEALEDLSNKLIEAQKNATKRIKELKAPKKDEPVVTKEQEALLAAELVQSPSETIKKILKANGVDLEDVKESANFVKTQKEATKKKTTADTFVATHKDYADTPHNGRLINKWCELHNDFSLEGMNKAYQDLNESGLLQVKGEEASAEQKEAEAEAQRIAEAAKVNSSQRTRKASGLSTHTRTPVPVKTELSEDEMYAMPLDKLRALANKQLAGN